jgi:integrase
MAALSLTSTFKTKARGKAVIEGGGVTAARTIELLGVVWSWAEKRGLVSGPNPARGIEKHRAEAKDRVLSPEEMAALGAVLREQEPLHPAATAALRLIALAGARREESCALRWREIDWSSGYLCASRQPKRAARSDPSARRRKRKGSGSADLKKQIAGLFDAAGLTDARAHDLRRTFGSLAADEGYGDATIGELLGHARRGVTARHYIRRPDAALVAAADRVAERIAASLDEGGRSHRAPRNSTRGRLTWQR